MISIDEKKFLSLLGSGLGNKDTEISLFADKETDWNYIFKMSYRHSVLAWVYDGIEKLPPELKPSGQFLMKWYTFVIRVETMNRKINTGIIDLAKLYSGSNIDFVLFKGQALSSLYPRPLHRQPGDVDVYIGEENYKRANRLLEMSGGKGSHIMSEKDKHSLFEWNGIVVENHIDMVRFATKTYSKAWNVFCEKNFVCGNIKLDIGNIEINVPSPYFNSIYLLLHILQHLQTSGIGLRQVCDFMTVIRNSAAEFDKDMWIKDIRSLGLERAYSVMACIGNIYFGIDVSLFPFYNQKYTGLAHKVMGDILEGGNFGREWKKQRFGTGNRLKRNIYLLKWIFRRFFFVRKLYPVESFNLALSMVSIGIKHNLCRIFKSKPINER